VASLSTQKYLGKIKIILLLAEVTVNNIIGILISGITNEEELKSTFIS
jgi:hypothetical protein